MLHGLTSFLPEAMLSVYDNLEFLIRIVISAVFGIFIGLERTKRQDGILDLHYVLRLKEQISHDETMALMDDCKEIYEIRIT